MRFTTIHKPGDVWDVIDRQTGKVLVADETYMVADSVCHHLNNPKDWDSSESREVADSILASL
jgi:hypothetical protein